ncbi:hypothetical protein Hanom_Chr01g00075611 [Helianthus anomalus]
MYVRNREKILCNRAFYPFILLKEMFNVRITITLHFTNILCGGQSPHCLGCKHVVGFSPLPLPTTPGSLICC